jgi:CRP-like cAMP-binding protein
LNILRLVQMQRQIAAVSAEPASAADGDDRFDWLIPLAEQRSLVAGGRLFARGDRAESLFVIVEGEIELPEIGVRLGPGAMLGEIGLFSEDRRRTTSAVARGPVELAELTERRVEQLYFDNPRFAYRLIRMITQRLIENLARLEESATGRRPDSLAAGLALPGRHDVTQRDRPAGPRAAGRPADTGRDGSRPRRSEELNASPSGRPAVGRAPRHED